MLFSSTDGGVTKHSDGLRVTAPTVMWVKVCSHVVHDDTKHAAAAYAHLKQDRPKWSDLAKQYWVEFEAACTCIILRLD